MHLPTQTTGRSSLAAKFSPGPIPTAERRTDHDREAV
jgi:hypothetical protein